MCIELMAANKESLLDRRKCSLSYEFQVDEVTSLCSQEGSDAEQFRNELVPYLYSSWKQCKKLDFSLCKLPYGSHSATENS